MTSLDRPEAEQERLGYLHTLSEIRQQPETISQTARAVVADPARLDRWLRDVRALFLTGSGSSEYVGHSVRDALQSGIGIPVDVVPAGCILTHGPRALPPIRPALMVSIARSGNSPESTAALRLVLDREPAVRHVVVTCNREGALSTRFENDPRVFILTLDPRTNDRSLVMTSSFTALATAARGLAYLQDAATYVRICEACARIIGSLLGPKIDTFERLGSLLFNRVVYLGSGDRFGAARESALKMLEMTAGRVATLAETYLGVRHGPMTFVNQECLVVCFLSSDQLARAYELDLIHELHRKQLGLSKVIIGEGIPPDLMREQDTAIECAGLSEVGDENAATVDVVCGQLLGLFRCLREGLRPDSPSESGVISRVVESFRIYDLPESH